MSFYSQVLYPERGTDCVIPEVAVVSLGGSVKLVCTSEESGDSSVVRRVGSGDSSVVRAPDS